MKIVICSLIIKILNWVYIVHDLIKRDVEKCFEYVVLNKFYGFLSNQLKHQMEFILNIVSLFWLYLKSV